MGAPAVLALSSLALTAAVGCTSSRAPDGARVRAAFERDHSGCRFERTEQFRLGGLKLAAVKFLVRSSDDEDITDMLSNLECIEIANYRAVTPRECATVDSLGDLGRELADLGWWPMVSERDGSESTWVFARGDAEGDLSALFVVTLAADELEVVRLEGRIDRILEEAVADDPHSAAEVVNPVR